MIVTSLRKETAEFYQRESIRPCIFGMERSVLPLTNVRYLRQKESYKIYRCDYIQQKDLNILQKRSREFSEEALNQNKIREYV